MASFGLLFVLIGIAWVLLPLVSFFRTIQLQREIDRLRNRLEAFEREWAANARPTPFAEPPAQTATPPSTASSVAVETPLAQPETSTPIAIPPPPTTAPAWAVEPSAPEFTPPEAPASRELDLEERIGGRWFQHVGLIVLLLGIAFFLRYAFEHAWLSPAVRVGLGLVSGVLMAVGGLRMSRTYRAYGLLLAAGGIAALYLSVYAGLNLYYLFGTETAFGLLVVITAAAAILADTTNSQTIAIFAVCGGFITPFLVGGQGDRQLTLFSYVALIVMATMYLAHRRTWPWLNVVSLALTALTILTWAGAYYTDDKYLRTELFLTLYCAMFLEILRRSWIRSDASAGLFAALLFAPVSYHVWSVVTLTPHPLAFLIYLIAFSLLMVGVAVHYESSLLQVVAWLGMALPLGVWIDNHHWRDWVFASVTAVTGIYLVHLAAQVRAVAAGEELDERDVALIHANGIGVFVALYQVLTDTFTIAGLAGLAVALAAANAGVWAWLRKTAGAAALHWLGVACTLLAIAIWVQLGGPWAVATWATEGAIVFWLALVTQRGWLRAGAWVLLALAVFRWLQPDIQDTTTSFVLFANARSLTGLYIVALLYAVAWLQPKTGTGFPAAMHERAALIVGASMMTVAVISTEIGSFFALRQATADAYIARQMMLTASWVIYAALLVAVGMRWKYPPIRYFAIALFGLSLVKVFVVDLETLGGGYRVAGFITIGLVLLLVSFLYQRPGVRPPAERRPQP